MAGVAHDAIAIPIVDIDPLRRDPASAAATAVVDAIDAACRETGFFVVTGHGIDTEMTAAFDAARAFFAAPQPVRVDVTMRNRCGYKADGVKEMFDVGLTDPANQWPAVTGFRDRLERYEVAASKVAADLLAALARALRVTPTFFAERMTAAECYLRLLHYPSRPAVPVSTGTHTDYGAVTLLATDGVAGLQVHPIGGPWIDVVAPPRSLVVNLGDMLARWTNDRYRSTPHRVVAGADRERYSIPFFVNPDPDTVVECIPSCIDAAHPCSYEPVTATDFLQGRIDGTIEVPLPAEE
jgi:isopenicillin N synthase-like dioxygenase